MPREISLYQIDAFTRKRFGGNPAAVCPLDAWLPDDVMQAIAAENNLSETAFFVPQQGGYALRWFTPMVEVDLCGHATLASAFVVFRELGRELGHELGHELGAAPGDSPGAVPGDARDRVVFHSPHSGTLPVTRRGDLLVLDFPARARASMHGDAVSGLAAALGKAPSELWASGGILVAVLAGEDEVRALAPDMAALLRVGKPVAVTAPGRDCDFVSRFFAPGAGIPEDPVTGSAHCALTPLWAERLGKTELHARQISTRGGELFCTMRGDRVEIAGHAVCYLRGTIQI